MHVVLGVEVAVSHRGDRDGREVEPVDRLPLRLKPRGQQHAQHVVEHEEDEPRPRQVREGRACEQVQARARGRRASGSCRAAAARERSVEGV